MKRTDFVKVLEQNGFHYLREGANHTIYERGDRQEAVPRHREIKESIARAVFRRNGIEWRKK
jgi:mRNA interferase HicA